ncbi:MAG: MauE/DoxX family redox-associated membrane protein [Candidatus Binatia bacterium]
MDPVLQLSLRAAFALLLASAAWHKLRDPQRFRAVLAAYELVPPRVAVAVAPGIGMVETLLAAGLLAGLLLPWTAAAVSLLMLAYAAAIEVNVRRGRTDIDCGCMGPASRVPLGRELVARNLVLALAAATLTLPAVARGLVWLDVVGFLATVAALVLLWLAGERMLVLAPRAAYLRKKSS